MLLEGEPDLNVSEDVGSGDAALEAIERSLPDLVLIDVSMSGMTGIDLGREIRRLHPSLRFAMLSGHREKTHVDQAVDAGAQGYILKGDADELPGAVRTLMNGESYFSPRLGRAT